MTIALSLPCIGPITQVWGRNVDFYKQWGYCCGHNGIDYGIVNGTVIKSAAKGKVAYVGFEQGGYGNYIKISHESGKYFTYYAHLREALVQINQEVANQQSIAHSDNTGSSTGPHLHCWLKIPGAGPGMHDYVDPQPYLDATVELPPRDDDDHIPPRPGQEFLVAYLEGEVIIEVLNIREGAGTSYRKVGSLYRGEIIQTNALTSFCRNGLETWVRIAGGEFADMWCAAVYLQEFYLRQIYD